MTLLPLYAKLLCQIKCPPARRHVPSKFNRTEFNAMKRIKTLETRNLCASAKKGGCGECQTSCQSACKTSCGVANQKCEKK